MCSLRGLVIGYRRFERGHSETSVTIYLSMRPNIPQIPQYLNHQNYQFLFSLQLGVENFYNIIPVVLPPGAWMFVYCECCVLLGRGLCDELITRPEESYRLWCVVVCDLETSRMRRPWPPRWAAAPQGEKNPVD